MAEQQYVYSFDTEYTVKINNKEYLVEFNGWTYDIENFDKRELNVETVYDLDGNKRPDIHTLYYEELAEQIVDAIQRNKIPFTQEILEDDGFDDYYKEIKEDSRGN